jgi:hypothetical protein
MLIPRLLTALVVETPVAKACLKEGASNAPLGIQITSVTLVLRDLGKQNKKICCDRSILSLFGADEEDRDGALVGTPNASMRYEQTTIQSVEKCDEQNAWLYCIWELCCRRTHRLHSEGQ